MMTRFSTLGISIVAALLLSHGTLANEKTKEFPYLEFTASISPSNIITIDPAKFKLHISKTKTVDKFEYADRPEIYLVYKGKQKLIGKFKYG